MVYHECIPLPLDAKDLLRGASGNTMTASVEVPVVSGLMYVVRFLNLQRKFGPGSAPMVGW